MCGHVVSLPLLRGCPCVQRFRWSHRRTATICSWLNLNSRQISGWNSQELIWQDDIMQGWARFRVAQNMCKGACIFHLHFWRIVLCNDNGQICVFFYETKRRITLWKREAQGYGMKSGLSQAAQDGRIWDGWRRSRPQTFSLFMSNSEAISHLVQSQTVGSTIQKSDNLRHGHVLVTILNSTQACFFVVVFFLCKEA